MVRGRYLDFGEEKKGVVTRQGEPGHGEEAEPNEHSEVDSRMVPLPWIDPPPDRVLHPRSVFLPEMGQCSSLMRAQRSRLGRPP